MDKIFKIYHALQDEKSKEIFRTRLMYSLTDEKRYVNDLVSSVELRTDAEKIRQIYREEIMNVSCDIQNKLIAYIKELKKQKVCVLCGAGVYGKKIIDMLQGDKENLVFCDKNADENFCQLEGVPVVSYREIGEKYKDCLMLVTSNKFFAEIKETLLEVGAREENIVYLDMRDSIEYMQLLSVERNDYYGLKRCDELVRQMYFDDAFMKPVEDEVFVDAGFFDGLTSRIFSKWCDGNYKKIIAFEPDETNYNNYLTHDDIERLELYHRAVWNCDETLSFAGGMKGGSFVDASGDSTIKGIAIDDVIDESGCTFIKMDVEGSELKALEGAKETIRKYHPRLAISIYHKKEDIIEIPAYILSLYPDYKLYIRHYTFGDTDTVLYAVEK